MSPWAQWALIVLGVVGASGTWLRAWVAYKEYKDRRRAPKWSL